MVAHISGKKSFGSYVWYTISISEQGKKRIADKKESSIKKAYAESEFEKYRVTQDKLYQSDFDKLVEKTKKFSMV